MAIWHTPTTLRAQWASAPADDALVQELLDVAQHQVLEFAPALAEDAEGIPDNYRLAQMLEARALWESQRASAPDQDMIGGEYQVRTYPMSAAIKAILRPPTAFKVIG